MLRQMGMLRRGGRYSVAAIEARIREAIRELEPLLRIDPAHIELVRYQAAGGVAELRVQGDCPDCDMSVARLMEGIAAHLRLRVPEIQQVRQLEGGTSSDE